MVRSETLSNTAPDQKVINYMDMRGSHSPHVIERYGNHIYWHCPRRHSLKITSKFAMTSPSGSRRIT